MPRPRKKLDCWLMESMLQNLNQRRLREHLTVKAMLERAKVSPKTYDQIVSGKVSPTVRTVRRLFEAFKTSDTDNLNKYLDE